MGSQIMSSRMQQHLLQKSRCIGSDPIQELQIVEGGDAVLARERQRERECVCVVWRMGQSEEARTVFAVHERERV